MNRIYSPYTGEELNRDSVVKGVPKSWQPIVDKLIDNLFEAGWDGSLVQIKEKFGSLRMYLGETNEKLKSLIEEAARETTKICIDCGAPATTTTKGWVRYVCDKHAE